MRQETQLIDLPLARRHEADLAGSGADDIVPAKSLNSSGTETFPQRVDLQKRSIGPSL